METKIVQKAVLFHDKKLLMLRRSSTDIRRPLEWDLPGGILEANEELIEGVKREIREETGLEVDNPQPFYATTKIRSWKDDKGEHTNNVVYLFYSAQATSKDVKLSHEHDKFQWSDLYTAIGEYEYPLQKEVLEYFKKIS
jgi:8-oxo-dGTP diphosphatase